MIYRPVEMLRALVSTPSPSREENATADLIAESLECNGVKTRRFRNCVWAVQPTHDPRKPTLMLNSHHDTVKPASGYIRDPYDAAIEGDRLYGLGSNDAGASVVTLMQLFMDHYIKCLPFNLMLAVTAEEEVMGPDGMRGFLPHIQSIGFQPDMVLVGEPTDMQPAVAERGLVVLDCTAHGVSGHAARKNGVNALYKAMADIDVIRRLRFPRESAVLGPVGLEVTMIKCGTQHNVIPDRCDFTVDVRTTDAYTNEETVMMIRRAIQSDAVPRSTRIQASVIDSSHPLVLAAEAIGGTPFVSPTTSDMALMHGIPSLKLGPGHSQRSHTADEYVLLSEIRESLEKYPEFLKALSRLMTD